MAKSSSVLLFNFQKKLQVLRKTQQKQEELFSKGLIIQRDLLEVYSAIFLSTIVSFEGLIEDMFFGLLTQSISSHYTNVFPRINVKTLKIAREIVLGDNNYCDWLPYERTRNRAIIFFRGGRPFSLLTDNDELHIERCLAIRNAIAHQGDHSQRKFERKVLSSLSLQPRERRPKTFLRAQFSGIPKVTYYELYTSELVGIAQRLC